MKWVMIGLGLIGLLAVIWLVATRPERPEPSPTPEPFEIKYLAQETLSGIPPEELAVHRDAAFNLYRRYQCVGCHADEGKALKKFEALGNKYNVESLAAYLKRPNPPMPIFPLSDKDREDLAIYLIDRYPGQASKSAPES